jgi:hypothetical protein
VGEGPLMIPPRGDEMLEVSEIGVIRRPPMIPPRGDEYRKQKIDGLLWEQGIA